jgi:putative endonuclease
MADCYAYIVSSEKTNQFYIGSTRNLEQRLSIHNDQQINTNSTRAGIPWKVYLTIPCATFKQAQAIERYIKRMKSPLRIF